MNPGIPSKEPEGMVQRGHSPAEHQQVKFAAKDMFGCWVNMNPRTAECTENVFWLVSIRVVS